MSSVETGQMPAVETGQMSAPETGQMSAVQLSDVSWRVPSSSCSGGGAEFQGGVALVENAAVLAVYKVALGLDFPTECV